jgi:hypothetical protein
MSGAKNPGALGAGTSPTSGGVQGFLMNFQKGYTGEGQNFQQLLDGAKGVDSFAKMLGDEGLKSFGTSKEELATLGAKDKISAITGLLKSMGVKEYLAKMQAFQDQTDDRDAMTAQQQIGPFLARFNELVATPEGQPTNFVEQNPPRGMSRAAAFAAANREFPRAASAPQLDNILTAWQKATEEPQVKSARSVNFIKSPSGATVALSPETGAFQYDPLDVENQRAANKPKISAKAMPVLDPYTKEPTGQYQTLIEGDPEEVNAWVQKNNKSNAPANGATSSAPSEIPADWIKYLKDHPESAASFDQKFGKGAAAKYLK